MYLLNMVKNLFNAKCGRFVFRDKNTKPTGSLALHIYKDNELIDIIEGSNLIVDEGADLLGNGLITEVTDDLVQTFGVGTGSGAATVGDTRATFTSIFTKSVATNAYVGGATQQLTYTFTLEATEYNGNTIKEFGLFSNGPGGSEKLFARRVLTGSIIKANDIRVEGTWIIQF
jgi:hypothetical protein